jgi:hypothetical protein
MKKRIVYTFLSLCLLVSSISLNAQIKTPQPSPTMKMETMIGLTEVTIEYSRPSMKERTIFAADGLVPFGETWRTGANASTKISFSTDVTVEGKEVKAGKYAVYAVPGKTSWDIILYKNTTHWGVPREWIAADEVARVSVPAKSSGMTVETFTIMPMNNKINSAQIAMMWDKTVAAFTVSSDVDKSVMKDIDRAMAGTSRGDYYTAARYFYDNDKDMTKALEWIKMANKKDAKFWQLRLQSLIEAKMGDKKSAIASAMKSMEMAKTAGNMDYVRLNEKSIAEWGGGKVMDKMNGSK